MTFAEILHAWLMERHKATGLLNLDDYMTHSGLSEEKALAILTGTREPIWSEAVCIAGVFGVTLEQFISVPRHELPSDILPADEAGEETAQRNFARG